MSPVSDTFAPIQLEPSNSKPSAGEAIELFGDTRRLEHLKQTLHWAVVWGVRGAAASMLILFLVRVWHLAAPEWGVWVDPDRLQRIDSLLFSGFLGAFIARYLNQAMPTTDVHKK